jgi:uncharacterized protein YdhG (YjbR/CyaY superfamily)
MEKIKFSDTDSYISSFDEKICCKLQEMRSAITEAAPEAEEVISYNMPAFRFHGILVYYAAHKEHIGFYPASRSILEAFKDNLVGYETSKGTIRFPYKNEIPADLVGKIVRYRVIENLAKKSQKKR